MKCYNNPLRDPTYKNIYAGQAGEGTSVAPWYTFHCKNLKVPSVISLSLQQILMKLHVLTKFGMINRAARFIFWFERENRKSVASVKRSIRTYFLVVSLSPTLSKKPFFSFSTAGGRGGTLPFAWRCLYHCRASTQCLYPGWWLWTSHPKALWFIGTV